MIKKSLKISTVLLLAIVLGITVSCSEDSTEDVKQEVLDTDGDGVVDSEDACPDVAGLIDLNGCPEEVVEGDGWSVNKENQQALNVVYFIPTDLESEEEYINEKVEDISEMMLFIQAWYAKQMEYQGYGDKTFGLLTNQENKVKVHVIKGENASDYYNNTSAKVEPEIKAYFASDSELSASVHTIVLGGGGSKIGFNGRGKWCYVSAGDYELKETGEYFEDLPLFTFSFVDVIMHELGHALNLPHNSQKASVSPNKALMGDASSIYRFEPSLVYLTKSDCAILDTNVLFNPIDNGISYYGTSPQIDLKTISIEKDNQSNTIKVKGSYLSDTKIPYNYIGFDFVNDDANPPNDNYDEITYTNEPILDSDGGYTFEFEVAYTDLFNGNETQNKDETIIELSVLSETGFRTVIYSHYYTTDINTEIPNDDIVLNYVKYELSDRSDWNITVNSASTEGAESKIIDGDLETYWHSYWPYTFAERGPHEINIDMGTTQDVNGLYMLSFRSGVQWSPKHIVIESSIDAINWNTAGSLAIESVSAAKEIKLDLDENNKGIRYIRISVDEIYTSGNNTSAQNLIFTEIDVY